MALPKPLVLTGNQRAELQLYLRKLNLPAAVAQRMRIVLALADGLTYREIAESLSTSAPTISLWRKRYEQEGLIGLGTVRPGQLPSKLTPALRARILARTRQAPPDGSTHWSLRKMAALLGVGRELIRKVWKEADLKPHVLEHYMASTDPLFEQKAADIIGLYMNRRSMRPSSASTRKARFRRWTGGIAGFRCRLDGPNGTALNTTVMAPCRCSQHWIREPAESWARQLPGTQQRTSSASSER